MQQRHNNAKQLAFEGFSPRPMPPRVTDAKLPTNVTANRHGIHRWFNFVAGFAPEFVARHCPSGTGSLILDPFAGCGTTLVVARSLGHRAVGFEPHPFFARIARAKVGTYPTMARLDSIQTTILQGLQAPWPVNLLPPAAERFLRKLFDESTLEQLLGAREALQAAGMGSDDLAFMILSRVIDMCSKSRIDGIYKAPESTKKAAIPSVAIQDVTLKVRFDMGRLLQQDTSHPPVLHSLSSEDMGRVATSSVDAVITSPPYLNNFDFAEMTRMYLYFWGICGSWQEITEKVRSKLVVNTTTALAGHRGRQSEYRAELASCLLRELDSIVDDLASQRRVRAGKKDYDLLVYPYFAQMTRILGETLRCLRGHR